MATNNNSQEEVDLGVLFGGIKRVLKRIMVWIYSFVQFIKRSWLILLALLIIGITAGYFLQKDKRDTKAVLLVQLNYNSYPYVYNAVELLNKPFLKNQNDSKTVFPEVKEIEIEPIVNIDELLEGFEDYERSSVLTLLLDLKDEEEGIYSADAFMNQYRFHRIEVTFPSGATQDSIEKLMTYLENNLLMQDISKIGYENFQQKIEDNKKMIRQIDEVLSKISGTNGDVSSTNLLFLGASDENSSVSSILEFKKELLEENDNLREALPTKEGLVVLINQPKLVKHSPLLGNKMFLLPFLLIGLYMLLFAIKSFYSKMKRIAINQ